MKHLNKETMQLLVGLLLGDGHISRSTLKSSIGIEQSIKHESYILYLYNILLEAGLPLCPLIYHTRLDKRYNKTNKSVSFRSRRLEYLNILADMFMSNGIKIAPLNIKEWLTPIALAHWICGDGYLVVRGGMTLCTDNYTLKDVYILMDALKNNFQADCTIHTKKNKKGEPYYRIYIGKASYEIIKPLIREHIHESFLYKIQK